MQSHHPILCWIAVLFALLTCTITPVMAQNQNAETPTTWKPQVVTTTFNSAFTRTVHVADRILAVNDEFIKFSKDDGKTWSKPNFEFTCPSGFECSYYDIKQFDSHPNTLFILNESPRFFFSFDAGDTWDYTELPVQFKKKDYVNIEISLNYANDNYILLEVVFIYDWKIQTFYTDDKFKTQPKLLTNNVKQCKFTKSNAEFTNGNDEDIVCVRHSGNFDYEDPTDLIFSKDFFKSNIIVNDEFKNTHIHSIEVKGPFIIVQVGIDQFSFSSSKMYTSKDGLNFKKCYFEGLERGKSFTVISATENSLYVVMRSADHMFYFSNSFYKSNSDGQYFNLIIDGISNDAENTLVKLVTFDGAWIGSNINNKIDTKEIYGRLIIKSHITFDDGLTWNYLNITGEEYSYCTNDDKCALHIRVNPAQRRNEILQPIGNKQGILVAIGAVGEHLDSNKDSLLHTFLSRDGGSTWTKIQDKPYVVTYANDGNILILHEDENPEQEYILYSLDQGHTWSRLELDIYPYNAYTKFDVLNIDKVLTLETIIFSPKGVFEGQVFTVIDFSDAFDHDCTDADMEIWNVRTDALTNQPSCVFGHSEKVTRRKQNSKCFNNKPIEVVDQQCQCTKADYECNSGFAEDDEGECQPVLDILAQYCETNHKQVKLSTRRKVPGDTCQGGYTPPEENFSFKCKAAYNAREKNSVKVYATPFDENVEYYQYLNKNSTFTSYQEETLVVVTESKDAFISFNGGANFAYVSESDEKYIDVITNPYWPDSLYLITTDGIIHSSLDRGKTFYKKRIPDFKPDHSQYTFSFNKARPRSYILHHHVNCENDLFEKCDNFASITVDNGQTFEKLADNANYCVFKDTVFGSRFMDYNENIICSTKTKSGDGINLIELKLKSDNNVEFKATNINIHGRLLKMMHIGTYFVVSKLKEDGSITAAVSVDGSAFNDVKFPFDLDHERISDYRVLDMNTKELYFYVTTNSVEGHEYGALLKSNFNGTLFSTTLAYVNQNSIGHVDLENIKSLEGLYIANVVVNPVDVQNGGSKKLVTKISHNNGGTWSNIRKPHSVRSCHGCSLHLHLDTDKIDPKRDSSHSNSAIGLLFGLGNVGLELAPLDDTENLSLYFSDDAGWTWRELFKGNYIWEFGDQGTLLVIVETLIRTNIVKYSVNYGNSWVEYQFVDDNSYFVEDITTFPSDNGLKFNLIVRGDSESNSMITIDFTNIYKRQCKFESVHNIGKDYMYFSPVATEDSCLFGHKVQYLRRKSHSDCFIGSAPLNLKNKIVKNCKCTREDYECDYNYELMSDNTCRLVKGLKSLNGKEMCNQDPFLREYWDPTGYRKLESSTCEEGLVLDKLTHHYCPSWGGRHGLHGQGLFWVIFIPIATFIISCVVIYNRGIRRMGGFRRVGEIHLDRDDNLIIGKSYWYDASIDRIVGFCVFIYHVMNSGVIKVSQTISKVFRRDDDCSGAGSRGAFSNSEVDNGATNGDEVNDDLSFGGEYHDDTQLIEN